MYRFRLFKALFQATVSISLRSLSTSAHQTPKTLTADYLVSCHGFSPDAAHKLSSLMAERGRSSPRFDSVITLFKRFGFTPASMASIFISYPNLLSSKAHENIEPKLEFLSASGLGREHLVHVICNDPFILMRSLESHLAPCVNCLIKFFGNRDELVSLFLSKRGSWALRNFSEAMTLNINALRAYGVPNSGIAKLITLRVRALSRTPTEFTAILDEIKHMGLDPSSMMFIYGVCSCAGMKREKWEAKINVFYKYGFSEAQFKALFVRQPGIMNSSMVRMEKILSYLTKEMGWTVEYITSYPVVLMSSFEKKIKPRLAVYLHLLAEGVVKETSVGRAVAVSEGEFYRYFLRPFEKKLPKILEMYPKKESLPLSLGHPIAT